MKSTILCCLDDLKRQQALACLFINNKICFEINYTFEEVTKSLAHNRYHLIVINACENIKRHHNRVAAINNKNDRITIITIDEKGYLGQEGRENEIILATFKKDDLLALCLSINENYKNKSDEIYCEAKNILLNQDEQYLIRNGKKIKLSASQFMLLKTFILNKDNIFSKEELHYILYTSNIVLSSIPHKTKCYDYIVSLIKNIRHKIGKDCIHTIRGQGYQWS